MCPPQKRYVEGLTLALLNGNRVTVDVIKKLTPDHTDLIGGWAPNLLAVS